MSFILKGERNDLAGALALASRFVASHKSNPQLNQLRLRRLETGESYVEATDQRASIRTALWATGPEEVDVLAHPDLANAVKAMSTGEVTIAQEDGSKVITVYGKGKAKYSVATLDQTPIDSFPGEDELSWEDVQPVNASNALEVMEIAARFTSKKEDNPSLVGVNLRVTADTELAVEATDGSRLFSDKVVLPSAGFPFHEDEVLLPPRMIAELGRVFPKGEVLFAATANLFFAKDPAGETLFASRRIGGKFPDVDKIVPTYKRHLRVPREGLADALDRMRTVVKAKPVQLTFEGDQLKLVSRTGTGSAEEWVDLPTEAGDIPTSIAFNVDYLAEALSLFKGAELRMHIETPLRPAKLDDSGVRFVLLAPVKFQ
jgi:DNA polymerase III sliding clamp (beta) subunit (PCNA family)